MCISVAIASIVPTPLLKSREHGLIGWADHLTLPSNNRSMTSELAGSSEMGRGVLSSPGAVSSGDEVHLLTQVG